MTQTTTTSQLAERQFSIMAERTGTWLDPIPWRVIALHENSARRNHGQSLERLQQRGGLTPREALAVLMDAPVADFDMLTFDECNRKLREVVAVRVEMLKSMPVEVKCAHGPRPEWLDDRGIQKCPNCGELINAS